jgi:hypothetical protein
MQITLEALDLALKPIEDLGDVETSFDVNGTKLALRLLTPEQETEVFRYANDALENSEEGRAGMEWMERFRLDTISHAVVAIGNLDLHGVDFVATGEKLDNGVEVKKPVALVVREVIQKQRWSGSVRLGIFRKYGEVVAKAERKAEKAIQFEPSNVDAEIERLETRLTALKAEKAQNASKQPMATGMSDMVTALSAEDAAQQEMMRQNIDRLADQQRSGAATVAEAIEAEHAPQAPAPKPPLASSVPPPQQRPRSSIPQAAPPPAPEPVVVQPPPPQAQAPQQPQAHQRSGAQASLDLQSADSFIDPSNEDSVAGAIAAANQEAFARRQGRPIPSVPSALDAVRAARRPPHAAALEASEALAQSPDPLRNILRGPVEEISERRAAPAGPPNLNGARPNPKTLNPRFRPPTR